MPSTLTAADFTRLRLRYGADPQPGEWPAAIEHDFEAGRMVDHYLVTPGAALLADEAVQQLGAVTGLLFLQQPDGAPWQVLLHQEGFTTQITFSLPEEEFRQLLANNGLILPGEPGFVPPAAR